MKQYETAFLIAPDLPEEDNEKLINKFAEIVSEKKGKMINIEKWGKRKLAYSIKKFDEAFYVFFNYEGEPDIPSELERNFKQTEAVIRYLTLKKGAEKNIRKKGKKFKKVEKQSSSLESQSDEKIKEIKEKTLNNEEHQEEK